jgi:hypothetical protein
MVKGEVNGSRIPVTSEKRVLRCSLRGKEAKHQQPAGHQLTAVLSTYLAAQLHRGLEGL